MSKKLEQFERSNKKINIRDNEMGDIGVIASMADLTLEDYQKMDKRALAEIIMGSRRVAMGGEFNPKKEEAATNAIMKRLDELNERMDEAKRREEEFRKNPQAFLDSVKEGSDHRGMSKEKRAELRAKGGKQFSRAQSQATVRNMEAKEKIRLEDTVDIMWPAKILAITTSAGTISHKVVGHVVNLFGTPYTWPPNRMAKVPISIHLRLMEMMREMEANQAVEDVFAIGSIKVTENVNSELQRIAREFDMNVPTLQEAL